MMKKETKIPQPYEVHTLEKRDRHYTNHKSLKAFSMSNVIIFIILQRSTRPYSKVHTTIEKSKAGRGIGSTGEVTKLNIAH